MIRYGRDWLWRVVVVVGIVAAGGVGVVGGVDGCGAGMKEQKMMMRVTIYRHARKDVDDLTPIEKVCGYCCGCY